MLRSQSIIVLIATVFACLISSCASYYQKNIIFQDHFVRGEILEADVVLDKSERAVRSKDRLLYLWQKGVVLQMLGSYTESNDYLEQAYIFSEDYRKNYTHDMLALLTNPMVKPYVGEDHELVLMHYYKAINYLRMNQLDEALVECRRINIKLNLLNDRYEGRKNRYKHDAFAMNLMGIVYEASGDVNNAFIAYRNAYNAYDTDYQLHFGFGTPHQLKKDLLRTAYLNGFYKELESYENSFGMKYTPTSLTESELIFFWQNGLGPVKGEWSINFYIVRGEGGTVTFVNEGLGLSFPFFLSPDDAESGGLGDLKFIRVAFPRYLERKPFYRRAEIDTNNKKYHLETVQNVNKIAISTLEDRILREFANSLLRLAVKQAMEHQARKKSEELGTLVSVVSSLTEKADTRNWQTLPYEISYARVPLNAGINTVTLMTYPPDNIHSSEIFEFVVQEEETLFHVFHSLESLPLGQPIDCFN